MICVSFTFVKLRRHVFCTFVSWRCVFLSAVCCVCLSLLSLQISEGIFSPEKSLKNFPGTWNLIVTSGVRHHQIASEEGSSAQVLQLQLKHRQRRGLDILRILAKMPILHQNYSVRS